MYRDIWTGETVFICASGPSLTREDVEKTRGKAKSIAINSTIRMAPWADALYACDYAWWERYQDDWKDFQGLKFSQDPKAHRRFGTIYVKSERKPGLGKNTIHQGSNSGYQAVNLAYLMGAKRMILLGFDMQLTRDRAHWHGKHMRMSNPTAKLCQTWVHNFNGLAKELAAEGVEVINCTRETALTCFPRKTLDDVL